MIKIWRNVLVPLKLYYATRYMSAQKKRIRKARAAGDFTAEAEAICRASADWGNYVIRAFHMEVSVSGAENLPESGPVVMISNHQGYSDIPILLASIPGLPMCYVAKEMMGRLPFYGNWMKRWQYCVLMRRDNLQDGVKCIREGRELLERGYSVAVFPEGTRSRSGSPGVFKKGSFRLATMTGVPILPVSVSGSYRVFEAQGYIRPAKIEVAIHPVCPTAGLDREERAALVDQVVEKICSAL